MIRRLHTNVKIFFPNPYVVRLEHDDAAFDQHPISFMKLTSRVRKVIQGTWGFSRPEFEVVGSPHGVDPWKTICRSYWCFKDEIDALQFRLMLDSRATQVRMWPERVFTIHETVETDEQ